MYINEYTEGGYKMNTKTKNILLKKVIISLLILSITLPILMPLKV